MELLSTILTCGLGAVGVALYVTARKRQGAPGWFPGRAAKQIEVVERAALTHQHSIHLVELKGRWMAIAVTPQGCQLLESGEVHKADSARAAGGHA